MTFRFQLSGIKFIILVSSSARENLRRTELESFNTSLYAFLSRASSSRFWERFFSGVSETITDLSITWLVNCSCEYSSPFYRYVSSISNAMNEQTNKPQIHCHTDDDKYAPKTTLCNLTFCHGCLNGMKRAGWPGDLAETRNPFCFADSSVIEFPLTINTVWYVPVWLRAGKRSQSDVTGPPWRVPDVHCSAHWRNYEFPKEAEKFKVPQQ